MIRKSFPTSYCYDFIVCQPRWWAAAFFFSIFGTSPKHLGFYLHVVDTCATDESESERVSVTPTPTGRPQTSHAPLPGESTRNHKARKATRILSDCRNQVRCSTFIFGTIIKWRFEYQDVLYGRKSPDYTTNYFTARIFVTEALRACFGLLRCFVRPVRNVAFVWCRKYDKCSIWR